MAALTNNSTAAEIMNALRDIACVNNRSDLVNKINDIEAIGDVSIKTSITDVVGTPALATDTWPGIVSDIQASKNTLVTNLGALGIAATGTESLSSLASKVVKDADLVTGNIKSGINIFGVAGKASVVDTASGNAASTDIVSGKTAYVNGALVTGNIAVQNNQVLGYVANGNSPQFTIPKGYWDGTKYCVIQDGNLIPANILSGISIFGVTGTAVSGKRTQTGTATSSSGNYTFTYADGTSYLSPYITVTGLTFKPSYIYLKCLNGSYEYFTIYEEISGGFYPKTAKVGRTSANTVAASSMNVKADVAPCSITSTGFTLPVMVGPLTYTWIAYE